MRILGLVLALVNFVFFANATCSAATDGEQAQPNMLIILADDCTCSDLPLYGGQNAKTPNIDKLATEGLLFQRAYLSSAMCQPCRAELYSGQYPLHNGCAYNHSSSRPTTTSLPQYLQPLGYRVGLAGKVHVSPRKAFPFENVPGFDDNCVRNPTNPHQLAGVEEFITRSSDQPFCLVVALVEPHMPWVMGDASQYPPAKLKLPPTMGDTPVTRKHFSTYLAEITYMDDQVGQILAVLEKSGKRDDTVVLFSSEQGSQFPGNKWTNWDTGVHTALIASWPNHIPNGQTTQALVQYADVAPTLIELAGGTVPETTQIDGTSFKSVLLEGASQHRQFVYHMHNNIPEGPSYPIRAISDGRFRYIRNLTPERIYIEKHLMGGGRLNNPYYATWLGADAKRTDIYHLLNRYMNRPAEELYLLEQDPYEMTNLIDDSQHAEILSKLRTELDQWMELQQDPGAEVDQLDSHRASKRGEPLFGVTHDN